MPIIAAETGSGNFTPAPAGVSQAVCCDVVDLGMVKSNYEGKDRTDHKIHIVWEIDEEMDDGARFTVRKRYTLSLHEKAALRKDLEGWRSKPFTPEERKGFDVEKLLGVNCMVNIVHQQSADGKTWANVAAIMPLHKGMPKIGLSGKYVRVKDRPTEQQPAGSPADHEAPPVMDEDTDLVPF